MFKTRNKKVEEAAKLDPDYRPTKELKPDEEIDEDNKPRFPLGIVLTISIIVVLMIVCIIVINLTGGPLPW
ncbi:MAG: hypothetical protein LBM03_00965 [Erysipelotrichaceae bacterium]|jgi:hypothetical protein|nr:hypothetical protein [Erysipelotrichaceae bacterium]